MACNFCRHLSVNTKVSSIIAALAQYAEHKPFSNTTVQTNPMSETPASEKPLSPANRSRLTAAEGLEAAFLQFVEATQELEVSQQKLSQEIYRLTEDLARSNSNLKAQIEAKERLTDELATLLAALPSGVVILQNQKVYAFNDVSASLVPSLSVGQTWSIPRNWTAIDDTHFRAGDLHASLILRPEQRPLADGRQMLLLHDVTSTFRTLEQTEREAKLTAMGRMAAEIAHQLRTPLATATLYASHLAKEDLAVDKRKQFAAQLNTQLSWLDGLVSRMMSFLRNRQGPSHMLCVAELMEECRSSIEPLFDSAGVKLTVTSKGGEHLVSVQRDQIRGGLISILENALRVSHVGQVVSMNAFAAGARVDIYIEDHGPGIPSHMMERLFEPFATGTARGTGLGLAIAKAAVEAHRGEIHVRNKQEGGAIFHVVLPVFEQL